MTEQELEEFKSLTEDLQIECRYLKGLLSRFKKTIDSIHPKSEALRLLKSVKKSKKKAEKS